jgi:hypothetical protein
MNQFFDFYHTPKDQWLLTASFYMEGDTWTWFQWMFTNGQILCWIGLLQALEFKFARSIYEDHEVALFKLYQTSIV